MVEYPQADDREDNNHNDNDYAKRHDHIPLLSAGGHLLPEDPWAAFSISSRFMSRFAPSWSAFS